MIHYHGKGQGRCACGYAGLGAVMSGEHDKVTCGMCKRVIEKEINPKIRKKGRKNAISKPKTIGA